MASTGFWPIKSRLKDVISYAENPDKTIEKRYLDEDLKNAIESSKSNDYYYFTKNVNSFNTNATCGYSGAGHAYGVRPNYSSVTYKNGVGKNYSYGGYNWSINYF